MTPNLLKKLLPNIIETLFAIIMLAINAIVLFQSNLSWPAKTGFTWPNLLFLCVGTRHDSGIIFIKKMDSYSFKI